MSVYPLYDVCVVGAGPSGATCAYYLARQGKRVLLLEKKRFPRDKLCGDAVCTHALVHLRRMGVLQAIVAEEQGQWAEIGGFVSPGGHSFIGNSAQQLGSPLVMAIKRLVLDAKIARAAAQAGAELIEQAPVAGAALADGIWTVCTRAANRREYQARVLVIADGASSHLARSLGIVTTLPDAVCSRAYVKASTTAFTADGVMFYPAAILPGYCALIREAGNELNFCCYLLPGGQAALADLRHIHDRLIREDPHVRQALGPQAQIERMRGGALRLGGVPRSYADHCLVIGDAAGHIDPLTGEGIQYGMDGAEIAATTLAEAFAAGDYRASFLQRYQHRWWRAFGRDFFWSRQMARWYTRYPIFLDACATLMQRRGAPFLAEWGEVMTGGQPKKAFFRPRWVGPLLIEVARQWWQQEPSRHG
jgi:geranylgeranyl reductase family protein